MDEKVFWEVIGGVFLLILVTAISQLRNEIARVNFTLDKIAKQIGVTDQVSENIDDELKSLLAEGKKIRAVKRYRMVTGHGLLESKKYVDSLRKEDHR
jgi:ribosomal protein L7/L12